MIYLTGGAGIFGLQPNFLHQFALQMELGVRIDSRKALAPLTFAIGPFPRSPTNKMTSPLDPLEMLRDAEWIHSLALAIARNPAEADDLSQATHLALLERPPVGIENPKAWLFLA